MRKGAFVVVANCQGWPLVQALQSSQEFQKRFAWVDIPPVFDIPGLSTDRQSRIAEQIAAADLLLYQPTKDRFGEFSTTSLLATRKPGSTSLAVPNCYFTGYQPEAFYLNLDGRRVVDLPSEYNDANLLWSASHGGDPDQAAARMLDPAFYPESFVEGNADDSLAELRQREQTIDVPMSDAIAERWRIERLFHAFNHPTNALMATLADRVLAALRIKAPAIEARAIQATLSRDILPIYAAVAEHLSLPPQTIVINGAAMNPQRYCVDWFKAFRAKYLSRSGELLADVGKTPGRAAKAFSAGQFARPASAAVAAAMPTAGDDSSEPSEAARRRCLSAMGEDPDFVLTKCDPQSMAFMTELMPVIAELYPSENALSTLDVGARTAAGTDLLARIFAPDSFNLPKMQVTALDIHPTYQAYSQSFHPRVRYVVDDIFTHQQTYDLVLCSHTIEHVDDPVAFVRRLQQLAVRHVLIACPFKEPPDNLIPGHLHSISWQFAKQFDLIKFRKYKSIAWHQSEACWFVLKGLADA